MSSAARIDQFFVMHSARADRWREVLSAAERWEQGQGTAKDVEKALADLEVLEEFHAYPGLHTMRTLRDRIAGDDARAVSSLVRRISDAILTNSFGREAEADDQGKDDEGLPDLLPAGLSARAVHRPYFEVLFVSNQPVARWPAIAAEIKRLRRPEDEFVYEPVLVRSAEDAICAAIVNPRIAACVINDGAALRSLHHAPVLRSILDPLVGSLSGQASGLMIADILHRLRPELDLYLNTDRAVETLAGEKAAAAVRRIFYAVEEPLELHLAILEGVRARYDTPFFDNLKRYAAKPVGTFHALPIARGKSVFRSEWIRDMGEFYGINLFLAESSATTGGLDSLLEPTGNIKKAQEYAARAFGADHVFFVTNGTSTSNKMVVQALVAPGDIVVVDRNCHKSHHYGLVLGGGQPLYVEAFPLTKYSMYGAVPLKTIKKALLDLREEGRLDRVRMLDLTNCTFDGHMYNTRRVMEECLAIKPDLIFLWDEAWSGFAHWSPFLRPRTAMGAAAALEEWLADPASVAAYERQQAELGGKPYGRDAAQDPPHSRSPEGQTAGVPDQLDPQINVGHPAGLDGPGQGCRFPQGGEPVPRGRVHARLDQSQPAAHCKPRRGTASDGAGRIWARHERDLDRAQDQARRQSSPPDLEVFQGARRRRADPGGVPAVRIQGLSRARHDLG